MTVILKRRAAFSAGLVGSPGVSAGGHNYVCELSVSGRVDLDTGMVINIKEIDAILKECVTDRFDRRILDRDVPDFEGVRPTLEMLAGTIDRLVRPRLPQNCRLEAVRLWETPTSWAEIALSSEETETMIRVTRAYDFSASHRLHAPSLSDEENVALFGKCNWPNGHGHNYDIEIALEGEIDPVTGRLFDPCELDAVVETSILKPFDHRHLNYDVPEFRDVVPTSENLAIVIWDRLQTRLTGEPWGNARLASVVVRETARNYFEYRGRESHLES